jgi:hypothetical protein
MIWYLARSGTWHDLVPGTTWQIWYLVPDIHIYIYIHIYIQVKFRLLAAPGQ